MKVTKKGFTLIELVVVMAIIAILSTIIVGAILAARNAATQTQRTGAVRTVETALESRATKCAGMYYAAVTGSSCPALGASGTGGAISTTTTSMTAIVDALYADKYLSTTVTIDADANYGVSILGNNKYTIKALSNPTTAGDDATRSTLYTAER